VQLVFRRVRIEKMRPEVKLANCFGWLRPINCLEKHGTLRLPHSIDRVIANRLK
jgi:hypothetical protein